MIALVGVRHAAVNRVGSAAVAVAATSTALVTVRGVRAYGAGW